MAMRLFLVYVLVELAVVVGLVSAIGFGWTFVLVVGTFALGVALAGSQVKRQVSRLKSGLASPRGGVSDGALVALGIVLTVIPGLVTSILGLLLLLPPTRAALRPAVTALALRGLSRVPVIVSTVGPGSHRSAGAGLYVDGEVTGVTDVTEVTDVEPPRLPKRID